MIGVAWSSRSWSLSAACARRLPDPDQEGIPVTQVWSEIRYHW